MLQLENAPRLVLGMLSTAPPEDATIAFANSARRVKSADSSLFDIRDLTAALSQVQGHASDHLSFEFKVPADASVMSVEPFTSTGDAEAQKTLLGAINSLMEWDWDQAKNLSKQVLAQTQNETLRDEALNVLAAAMSLTGDIQGGISALKQATEGQWNFALQQNLGILALKVDPKLAANQSTYWLDSASSSEDQERAVFLVMKMWASTQDEEGFELPEKIRDSFRGALAGGITASTFATLGLFMARNDGEWVSDSTNWKTSPHYGSELGELIKAQAHDTDSFIDFIIDHAASSEPEIIRARDNFVSELVEVMLGEGTYLGAASFGVSLVNRGLPCDSLNNALLRALSIREICNHFRENEGEPKEEFVDWLIQVNQYALTVDDSDLREFLTDVLTNSATLFTIGFIVSREKELENLSDTLPMIHSYSQRWSTRRRLNKAEVRNLARGIDSWSHSLDSMSKKLLQLPVSDQKVLEFLASVTSRGKRAGEMANEILGRL